MTTRGFLLAVLALSLSALTALAADPALLKLLPAEAAVVGGVNLERAKGSPFGQFLLKQIQLEDKDLRELMEATGFDPRRDLKELVFAADGVRREGRGSGLVAAGGQFDTGRILAMVKQHGAPAASYAGVDIYGGKGAPHSGAFAFLSSSVAVAGDEEMVRAAIDRYRQGGAALSAPLAAKVSEWSGKADAWFVTSGSPANWGSHVTEHKDAGPLKAVPLEAIEQSAGGVRLGAAVTLLFEAVARTEKDAVALADVVRFVAGMVQLNREKPEATEFAKVIDTLELKSDARTVTLSISVPEEQLEKMVQSHRGSGEKRAPRKGATI